jgi:hypothetical protein
MFSSASTLANPLPPFCLKDRVTCAGSGIEVVCQVPDSSIISGGGFSNVAPAPSWQTGQIKSYLANSTMIPPANDFNSSGRAYPDIAALAHNFMIVKGHPRGVDG